MALIFFIREESPDSRTDGVSWSIGFRSNTSGRFAELDFSGNAKPVRATVTNRVAPNETTKLQSFLNFFLIN